MKLVGGRLTLHWRPPVSSDDVARVSSNAGPVCGRAVAGGCRACSCRRHVLSSVSGVRCCCAGVLAVTELPLETRPPLGRSTRSGRASNPTQKKGKPGVDRFRRRRSDPTRTPPPTVGGRCRQQGTCRTDRPVWVSGSCRRPSVRLDWGRGGWSPLGGRSCVRILAPLPACGHAVVGIRAPCNHAGGHNFGYVRCLTPRCVFVSGVLYPPRPFLVSRFTFGSFWSRDPTHAVA